MADARAARAILPLVSTLPCRVCKSKAETPTGQAGACCKSSEDDDIAVVVVVVVALFLLLVICCTKKLCIVCSAKCPRKRPPNPGKSLIWSKVSVEAKSAACLGGTPDPIKTAAIAPAEAPATLVMRESGEDVDDKVDDDEVDDVDVATTCTCSSQAAKTPKYP